MAFKNRTWGLALGAVLGVFFAWAVWQKTGNLSPHLPLRLSVKAGELRRYELDYSSVVQTENTTNIGQSFDVKANLKGIVEIAAIEDQGGGEWLYLIRSLGAKLEVSSGGQNQTTQQREATEKSLHDGLQFVMRDDGALVGFQAGPAQDRFALTLLQHIVSGIQWRLPPKEDSTLWKAEEFDGTGTFISTFAFKDEQDNGSLLQRTKTGYTALNQSSVHGQQSPQAQLKGDGEVLLDNKDAWPIKVVSKDSLEMTMKSPLAFVSRGQFAFNFQLLGKDQLKPDDLLTEARKKVKGDLSEKLAQIDQGQSLLRFARERIGDKTADAIWEDFKTKSAAVDLMKEPLTQRALFDDTVAWVRLNGGTVKALEPLRATFKDSKSGDAWLSMGMAALATVGTPASQKSLVTEMRQREQEPLFAAACVSLLGQPLEPTTDLEAYAKSLTESPNPEISSTADLALGNIAYHLDASSPERTQVIAEDYQKRFAMAAEPKAKAKALRVLANIGGNVALTATETLQRDVDQGLRSTATQSLYHVAPEQAAPLLNGFLTDNSLEVRQEAAKALSSMGTPVEFAPQLLEKLGSEKDSSVRRILISALLPHYDSQPEVKKAIDTLAQSEQDEQVKGYALAALAGIHGGKPE